MLRVARRFVLLVGVAYGMIVLVPKLVRLGVAWVASKRHTPSATTPPPTGDSV